MSHAWVERTMCETMAMVGVWTDASGRGPSVGSTGFVWCGDPFLCPPCVWAKTLFVPGS